MFTIETEIGRFEATDEREAKKLLRRAEREHKKQEKIDSENRERARLKARSEGFHFLSAYVDKGNPISNPWIVRPGQTGFPVRYENGSAFVAIDNHNQVEMELFGYAVSAVLIRSSGDVAVIWTESTWDGKRTPCTLAVGYFEDQTAFVYLPVDLTAASLEN